MEIQPSGSRKAQYQKEIKEGVHIFDESFRGLKNTNYQPKRQEYEKAIDESMQALHDLAKAMVNKKMMKLKDKLDKDYHDYLSDPSQNNAYKVEEDLKEFKRFE